MTLLLDDKRMVQTINGQPPQTITADNNPQMFQFNHLLRALFRADRKVLEENFRIDFQDREGCWSLVLTPTTTPLNTISPPSIWAVRPFWSLFVLTTNRATVRISPSPVTD